MDHLTNGSLADVLPTIPTGAWLTFCGYLRVHSRSAIIENEALRLVEDVPQDCLSYRPIQMINQCREQIFDCHLLTLPSVKTCKLTALRLG